jgi:hypothetical protein
LVVVGEVAFDLFEGGVVDGVVVGEVGGEDGLVDDVLEVAGAFALLAAVGDRVLAD